MDDNYTIPDHSIEKIDKSLEITNDVAASPYAIHFHDHLTGVAASTWRVRNLSEWSLISKYDLRVNLKQAKQIEIPDFTIEKGDHIAIRFIFENDSDEDILFGHEPGKELARFDFVYTTDGHDGFEMENHRHINFSDLFTNVPETEANTLLGKIYEPCLA